MIKIDKRAITSENHHDLWKHDEQELFSDNPNDYYVMHYRRRIARIKESVLAIQPQKALEIGCAQGNLSLELAESGIQTIAMDINFNYLTYSKMKWESGAIQWIQGSADHLPLEEESMDCVILAEILEHCAYPEEILKAARRVLKPAGRCIITTPNGESRLSTLLSFKQVAADRTQITQHQFGPDGEDHLFAFTQKELHQTIVDNGFQIVESGTLCHHFLMWKRLYHLRRQFPNFWTHTLERAVPSIPFLKNRHTHCLFVVAEK